METGNKKIGIADLLHIPEPNMVSTATTEYYRACGVITEEQATRMNEETENG